jgi:hypothetical protein
VMLLFLQLELTLTLHLLLAPTGSLQHHQHYYFHEAVGWPAI